MLQSALFRSLFPWLTASVLATLFCILVYSAVQQDIRSGANDPQIQMAEDAARDIASGRASSEIIGQYLNVDIGKSLAPFISVYDEEMSPSDSSGMLDGTVALPPVGVFEKAKRDGEVRLTWEPQPKLRFATIVVYQPESSDGKPFYVLSGMSLREAEKRESFLAIEVLIAWFASVILIFLGWIFSLYLRRP